jgi:hypothetical protein
MPLKGMMMGERMLKWFEYGHSCDPGPERSVALRKLLEAKDAAVRAKLNPGG